MCVCSWEVEWKETEWQGGSSKLCKGTWEQEEGGRALWRNRDGDGVVKHAGFAMIDWLQVRFRR